MSESDIDVVVCEVGLRDGLQMLDTFFPTEEKLRWIRAEAAAGVREIEVTSLVPPKLVPQFADSMQVLAGALAVPGITVLALAPNLKGFERAVEAGVHKVNYVMSVSRTHNLKNVRREREASLEDFKAIAARRNGMQGAYRPRLLGGLSSAMGCAYEGAIDPAEVVECAVALAQAGADEIMIADTVGHASPTSVRQLFKAVIDAVAPLPVAAHFHDTRGLGLANVSAALDVGVRRFDASLAGLGGCQFVPNATGNIVMDDLCFMLESMGLRTGVDLNKLLAVRELVAHNLPSTPLYGSLARAGLPTGYQAHS